MLKSLLCIAVVVAITNPMANSGVLVDVPASNVAGSQAPPSYGLRLDGFYDGRSRTEVTFDFDDVIFTENDDSTARLFGVISVAEFNAIDAPASDNIGAGPFDGFRYDLDVHFARVTDSADLARISNFNPDFRYYLIIPDGIELVNLNDASDSAHLWSFPEDGSKPFQVGIGANGKDERLGAASWLSYEHFIMGEKFGKRGHLFESSDFLMQLDVLADVENEIRPLPVGFHLNDNFPNPFNPTTTIQYSLPSRTKVNLSIYNVLGQKVRTLANEIQTAGIHTLDWDGKTDFGASATSGLYFYRIKTADFVESKKMILLK